MSRLVQLDDEGEPVDPEVYMAGQIVHDALVRDWDFDIDPEYYYHAGHKIVYSGWLAGLLRGAFSAGQQDPTGANPYAEGGVYYHGV